MRKLVLMLPLFLAVGFGQELLTNGDFEQDLTVGWTFTPGGAGYPYVGRDIGYQPDPDYEALDSLYAGAGWSKLEQVVEVPGPRLALSFWAKFEIGGGSSTCWPVACITVGYYDASDVLLGETRYYYHNSYCNWVPSNTLSLIDITNPDWTSYTLDIAQELGEHLSGVNPDLVAKVGVGLYNSTSGG